MFGLGAPELFVLLLIVGSIVLFVREKGKPKEFVVYRHASGAMEIVKNGWSWPGMYFAAFWALYKQLWVLGAGALIGTFVIAAIFGNAPIVDLFYFGILFFFGFKGNELFATNLIKKGYVKGESVEAASKEAALATLGSKPSQMPPLAPQASPVPEQAQSGFCSQCGTALKAGSAFCGKCGFKITD